MAYYEMIFGSGTAWCNRYIIKTEYPTTDYGALVDAFIDYAREKGYSFILTEYDCVNDEMIRDSDGWEYGSDEYVIGGNYGDALIHHGIFTINEINENEIGYGYNEVVEVA